MPVGQINSLWADNAISGYKNAIFQYFLSLPIFGQTVNPISTRGASATLCSSFKQVQNTPLQSCLIFYCTIILWCDRKRRSCPAQATSNFPIEFNESFFSTPQLIQNDWHLFFQKMHKTQFSYLVKKVAKNTLCIHCCRDLFISRQFQSNSRTWFVDCLD